MVPYFDDVLNNQVSPASYLKEKVLRVAMKVEFVVPVLA